MDKNTITGFVLIFMIMMGYSYLTAPTPEMIAEKQKQERVKDSLRMVNQRLDSLANLEEKGLIEPAKVITPTVLDSAGLAQANSIFGEFGGATAGVETKSVLKNDLFEITLSNKGGRIKQVKLFEHQKITEDEDNKEIKEDLLLLNDRKDQFNYHFPLASNGRIIESGDLFFEESAKTDSTVTFRAAAGSGYFEQKYQIQKGTYNIDYDIKFVGLDNVLKGGEENIKLEWVNHLDKLEKNVDFEKRYSTLYFHETEDGTDYCSCTSSDKEDVNTRVKWVSNSNQFFNSTIIAKDKSFVKGNFETIEEENLDSPDLKKTISHIYLPRDTESFAMQMYIGPNEFNRLRAYGNGLEDIIPFGSSLFGSINRWIIRPLFNFLSQYIGSAGIVILILTLIIKLVLFPLTYKMIRSQAKMGTLKPQIAKIKEKYKDDAQQTQVETMKLYREYGVSPLGGCMPMVLQMPVWFALYRFFPAAIEFRQKSFLWATDLSSYDAPISIPDLPLIGDHLSLFTILWALTTILYSWYNTRLVDMSQGNPAMKYMQYFMPIMFIFFFNNYAAGLTCYLFFSSLINVIQTVATKNLLINEDKLKAELQHNKANPKKKSGFAQKLEEAMKEQQKKAEAAEKKAKGKKKK